MRFPSLLSAGRGKLPTDGTPIVSSSSSPNTSFAHDGREKQLTEPEALAVMPDDHLREPGEVTVEDEQVQKRSLFAYFKTRNFWLVLLLGQILSLCITATNTLTTLLVIAGTSIPAFQTLFNYVLLNLVFTSYTLYKYGFKRWARLLLKDGWKFFLFAFCDVQGNYFTVLAYNYTTIISAQLINFWAIVVVVIVSFLLLKVRYRWYQIIGIIICIGGEGIIMGSDHITGANAGPAVDLLKGDLFALLGATFYGVTNLLEEFLVTERPVYEVLGQLGFWGMIINGVQAAIFARDGLQTAVWTSDVGGYLAGYTLILFMFYVLAPLMFRMSSAAFFNISLLTANFWGVAIGVSAFGYSIHWMYYIAFVCILFGHFVYYFRNSPLAESLKPWLGKNQAKGVSGLGTAKRRIVAAENRDVV